MGQVFQNHDLAKALRLVAENGADAFYKGEIARAILSTSQSLGGTMAADDLAEFSPEWVEPISTTYRDWTVYELPPEWTRNGGTGDAEYYGNFSGFAGWAAERRRVA